MIYAPDFTHDLESTWGLKSFTLNVEGYSPLLLSSCVMEHPKRKAEMEPAAGQVPQYDREFTWDAFHTDPIVGDIPLGSVLVDGRNVYWTILTLNRIETTETITAHCRNLSVVTNKTNAKLNTATILKAKWGKGRANEAKAEWFGYSSGLNPPTTADQIVCRIQPSAEDAMIRFNGEWTKETFRVILQSELPLEFAGADYRLVDENGGRYRIMHHAQAQRIDALPVLICVRITEGIEFFGKGQPQPLPTP